MSENKKIENAIPEVKDDELDAVTGGVKRTASPAGPQALEDV